MANVTRGGKHRPLTKLQLRRAAFDAAKLDSEPGFKRPGSNNRRKQA